jgi:hypothetical protein
MELPKDYTTIDLDALSEATEEELEVIAQDARRLLIFSLLLAARCGVDEETVGDWVEEAAQVFNAGDDDEEERCGNCPACKLHKLQAEHAGRVREGMN